jgi:hypothetical protein
LSYLEAFDNHRFARRRALFPYWAMEIRLRQALSADTEAIATLVAAFF